MLKAKKLNFIARSVSLNQQLRPHTGRYLSAKMKSWPSLGRDKNFIPIQHAWVTDERTDSPKLLRFNTTREGDLLALLDV